MVKHTFQRMILESIFGISIYLIKASVSLYTSWPSCITHEINVDIVDIKPANMEELTEVITAAEFHPLQCNLFMYSSSKGTIKMADMRESALCDQRAKGKYTHTHTHDSRNTMQTSSWFLSLFSIYSVWSTRRPQQSIILFWDHFLYIRCQVQSRWPLHSFTRLSHPKVMGYQHGKQACHHHQHSWSFKKQTLRLVWEWLHIRQVWMHI